MDIIERVNKRIGQQTPSVQPIRQAAQGTPLPARIEQSADTGDWRSTSVRPIRQAAQGTILPTLIEQPNIKPGTDTRDWRRTASYDEAVKIDPTLTRAGYIGGVSQYRAENGMQPLSFAELYSNLAGHNPFQSAEQEAKQEQKLRRAERVNAIGNVLANLVNYVRTVNGNPAMRLQPIAAGQQRIDQLRAYQDALDNSRYKDYMAILGQQRAEDAARDAAAQKFQQQIFLENLKQNNPVNLARAKAAEAALDTEAAKRNKLDADIALVNERLRGEKLNNDYMPQRVQADIELKKAQAERARKGGSNGNKKDYGKIHISGGKGQSRDYDMNKDEDVALLYNLLEKRWGLDEGYEYKRPKTIDEMREFILTSQGIQRDVKENVWTLDPNQQDKYSEYEIPSSDGTDWSQYQRK